MNRNCLFKQCTRKLPPTSQVWEELLGFALELAAAPEAEAALAQMLAWLSLLHLAKAPHTEKGKNVDPSHEPCPETPGLASWWFQHGLSDPSGIQIAQDPCWPRAGTSGIFLHEIFGGELPGLSRDEVFPPRMCPCQIQNFPDFLFGGTVAPQEDHLRISIGMGSWAHLFTKQHPLIGEAHFDGEARGVGGGIHFLHMEAKDHRHELRGSQKDLNEVVFVPTYLLRYWLFFEIHRHVPV